MTRPLEELFDELSGSARSLGPADWPEPANLRRRAEHRRTVRRASIASSVAVVAAVAIAVPAALAGHRNAVSPTGHTATEPVTTHKAASTPGPSRIPAGTSATPAADTTIGVPLPAGALAPAGQRQAFGKVSLVVPDGWQVYRHAQPSPYDPRHEVSDEACIAPPPAPSVRSLFDCAGLEVFYGGFLPAEGTNKYDSNRERSAAWHHGTGAPTCPGTLDNPGVPAVTPLSGPADWTFPEIGSERKAQYTDWHVACADGTSFNPQAWYLPRTRVLFFSYVSDPTAQAILATAVVS